MLMLDRIPVYSYASMWENKYVSITKRDCEVFHGPCLIDQGVDPYLSVLSVVYMSLVLSKSAFSSFPQDIIFE